MLKPIGKCTGCAACEYVCPHNAITMVTNKQGFIYPAINTDYCVHCGLCEKVCAKEHDWREIKKVVAFQSINDSVLSNSASGGAIAEIVNRFIKEKGQVCAVSYDIDKGAQWIWVNDSDSIKRISGSKYFQIPLRNQLYVEILEKLKDNTRVLFIGTPCQVDGIKKGIPEKYQENLYLIDIVCGGVASPLLEKKYINYIENSEKKHVKSHLFRSKDAGWNRIYTTVLITEDNRKITKIGAEDLFIRAYTSGRYMRESCYGCEYATRSRISDITVGDCWGIETEESRDQQTISKGVSLLTCNSEKGEHLVRCLSPEMMIETDGAFKYLSCNKPLNEPSTRPLMRSFSYRLLNFLPFSLAVNIVCYRRIIKKHVLRRKIR